jgi:hypothetical protein
MVIANASTLGMQSQKIPPLQPGSISVLDSAQRAGQQNQQQQNCLIGNCATGGSKRMRYNSKSNSNSKSNRKRHSKRMRMRGGQVIVPAVSTNGVQDNGATQSNVNSITKATISGNMNAGYDSCVGQGSICTAQVALSQQKMLTGGVKWGKSKRRKIKSRKLKSRKLKSRKYNKCAKCNKYHRSHH